jgi:hypothetical protein
MKSYGVGRIYVNGLRNIMTRQCDGYLDGCYADAVLKTLVYRTYSNYLPYP